MFLVIWHLYAYRHVRETLDWCSLKLSPHQLGELVEGSDCAYPTAVALACALIEKSLESVNVCDIALIF